MVGLVMWMEAVRRRQWSREAEVSITLPGFSIPFFHASGAETVESAPGVVGMNEISHSWDQS